MHSNKLLAVIFSALMLSACSSKSMPESISSLLFDTNDITQEEFALTQDDSSEDENTDDFAEIKNPEKFIKYYLQTKISLYNSDNLTNIANFSYDLFLQDPANAKLQEQAFLLLIASQQYAKALNIINSDDVVDQLAFKELFLYSHNIAQDNVKKSEEYLNELLVTENRLPHLKILKAYFNYNKHEDIEELKKEIAAINSSTSLDGFKFYYIARAYEAKGDYEEAFKLYSNAFFINTLRTADVFERLVYTAQKVDPKNKEKLLESNSKYGENIYLVDQSFIDLTKLKALDNSLQAVSSQILYDLGWSIIQTTANLAGIDFLALADYIKPADKAKIQMAKGYYNNSWRQSAIEVLESINSQSSSYISANILLADIIKETDAKKAVDIINKLRQYNTINPYYLDTIVGQIYLNDEQFEKSIPYLTNALKNDKSSKIYFSRAVAYERTKQYEPAIKDLEVALDKNPTNPIILNYLGYLLIDLHKNTDKGLKLIKKAVKLDPLNPASLDSLGWAYIKLKEYKKGLTYLEQAHAIDSDDGVITGHLGDAYYHNGREKEAVIYWNKALELEKKDDREIQRIKNQLYKYNNQSKK